jgi:hypothetical protein
MKTPKSGEASTFPLGDIFSRRALDHFHREFEKTYLPDIIHSSDQSPEWVVAFFHFPFHASDGLVKWLA